MTSFVRIDSVCGLSNVTRDISVPVIPAHPNVFPCTPTLSYSLFRAYARGCVYPAYAACLVSAKAIRQHNIDISSPYINSITLNQMR
jgi:hypothetical protein